MLFLLFTVVSLQQFEDVENSWHCGYLVNRLSCIRDAFRSRRAVPNAPLPPYLATRGTGVNNLPIGEYVSFYHGVPRSKLQVFDAEVSFYLSGISGGDLSADLLREMMMYF
jgi:hypothetical protein